MRFSVIVTYGFIFMVLFIAMVAIISFHMNKVSLDNTVWLLEKDVKLYSDSTSLYGYKACQKKKNIYITKDTVDYLAVADFSLPSSVKRFYVYHLPSQTKILTTYVTHGKHSGGDSTTSFFQ
jgi:hypothetical protein